MGWTDPTQRTTGTTISQSIYNTDLVDNLAYLSSLAEPRLTNKSGGAVEVGDVVVVDNGYDSAFKTTTTVDDVNVIGVANESIADDAQGRVAALGVVTVKVQGNVTRGDFLSASATAGRAASVGTSKTAGAFAKALTAYSGGGAGTVTAILMISATSGMPQNGTLYTTAGSAPAGFSEYTNARGRMIVGLPSGGTNGGTVGTALSNLQDKTHAHTYTTVIAHLHSINVASNVNGTSNVSGSVNTTVTGTRNTNSTGSASGTTATSALSNFLAYIQLMSIKKD